MSVLFEIFLFFVSASLAQSTLCTSVDTAADPYATDPFATVEVALTNSAPEPWKDLPSHVQVSGEPIKESVNFRVFRGNRSHLGHDTEVAVRQGRGEATHRIRAEANILRSIENGRHPGKQRVVRVAESGPDYLATEWVNGKTLFEILSSGKLTTVEAEGILAQVREAVAAIHAAGYVHADLHPKNILVSNLGDVKIIDMGISVRVGTDHVSKGAPATASENQRALGRAAFADDFHSLGVLETLVRSQVDDANFSLEPFRKLGNQLGITETVPRKFFRAVSSAIRNYNHVVPPDLHPTVLKLNEKFAPWFSPDLHIERATLSRPLPRLGTLEVPLPPRYDLHVPERDRAGTPERETRRGVVQWKAPSGRIFFADVVRRDPISVDTALSRLPASDSSLQLRLAQLPKGSTITTVLTRISSENRAVAKAEIHLVEDAEGNQILILDKIFTDLAGKGKDISGSFAALQAINALPNLKPEKIRALHGWEIVNAETIVAMQESRRLGKGESDADRFRGTPMDTFLRSLAVKMELPLQGNAEIRNGVEQPLHYLAKEATSDNGGITFAMPDLGSPIRYDNSVDGRTRRFENGKLLNDYGRASGQEQEKVRDISAVSRFDAVYRVGGN